MIEEIEISKEEEETIDTDQKMKEVSTDEVAQNKDNVVENIKKIKLKNKKSKLFQLKTPPWATASKKTLMLTFNSRKS